MEVYGTRLRSYDKSKPKSTSKPAWPHPNSFLANPKSLSEAGFFHNPTKDDLDSVQCFMCKTELVGWDKHDNPFEAHLGQSPECPWAIARCSLEFDVDSNGNFSIQDASRLPSNKALEKARLETYGGKLRWWRHDSVKNHGATSKKMAKAGFVYTPQEQGDDTTTCFYCNLALSGWEAGDDPIEEHRSRSSRADDACPFFLTEVPSLSQSKQKAKATATRKSRTKRKRLASDNELETKELPLPAASQQTEAAKKKTSIAPGRKKSRKPTLIDTEIVSNDDTEGYQLIARPKMTSKSLKKSNSAKAKESLATKRKQQTNPALESDDNEALENNGMQTRPPSRLGKVKDQAKTLKDKMKPKRMGKMKGKEKDKEEAQHEGQDSERIEVPSLTDAECSMTVEEWIRHEMAVQYEKLRQDGEMRIQAFRKMAAQVRARIEAL